jgi:hypothetical protein
MLLGFIVGQWSQLTTYSDPDDDLTRIIREVITNDSQWCKVGYESR